MALDSKRQESADGLAKANESMHRAINRLAQAGCPSQFIHDVLEEAASQTGAHSAAVFTFDPAAHTLRLTQCVIDGQQVDIERDARMRNWRKPIAADAIAGYGKSLDAGIQCLKLVPPDPEIPPQFVSFHHSLGHQAIARLPLLRGAQPLGMVCLGFVSAIHASPEEMGLLCALAQQITLALEFVRLGESAKRAAVLEERNRIARDIHDSLAYGFTGIIVQLEAAEEAMHKGKLEIAGASIQRAGRLARHSLAEARQSVRALRPQVLEEVDLCVALNDLLKQLASNTQLEALLSVEGKRYPLPPDWEENLLKISQEAITNTVKHAAASHFDAKLIFEDDGVRLELNDNGVGFDATIQHDGLGLIGMRERVERIGGLLQIASAPGNGTRILVTLHPDGMPLTDSFL